MLISKGILFLEKANEEVENDKNCNSDNDKDCNSNNDEDCVSDNENNNGKLFTFLLYFFIFLLLIFILDPCNNDNDKSEGK